MILRLFIGVFIVGLKGGEKSANRQTASVLTIAPEKRRHFGRRVAKIDVSTLLYRAAAAISTVAVDFFEELRKTNGEFIGDD